MNDRPGTGLRDGVWDQVARTLALVRCTARLWSDADIFQGLDRRVLNGFWGQLLRRQRSIKLSVSGHPVPSLQGSGADRAAHPLAFGRVSKRSAPRRPESRGESDGFAAYFPEDRTLVLAVNAPHLRETQRWDPGGGWPPPATARAETLATLMGDLFAELVRDYVRQLSPVAQRRLPQAVRSALQRFT